MAAVKYARAEGLPISIYGGGHSVTGAAVVDGGLMIDMRGMKGITVDPEARTARAEAGLNWGEFDAATQEHGLAVTGGRVPDTGIAGLALGSGSGWLERKLGFTCDNLLAAEVVTADGTRRAGVGTTRTPTCSGVCAGAVATSGSSPRSRSSCTRSARWCSAACSRGRRPWPVRSCASGATS